MLSLITIYTIFIVCLVIMMLASTINFKPTKGQEKLSPFECGFDPLKSARQPFSLQFFLIAIIFLIFDVEITLLLPVPNTMNLSPINPMAVTFVLFIIMLLAGLFHEWNQGALEWVS